VTFGETLALQSMSVLLRLLLTKVFKMARAIWKGAISFGLVHIPVSLVSATSSSGIDFDWLDKRSMEPVGYKQINKVTGKEIDKKNIVKGIQYEKGRYVVLSEEEIKAAHPRSTQAIDIFSFVDKSEIPITHLDTPYYLAPDKRGEKVYALLRESLVATNKVALANVVIRIRQHLAVLMPLSSALALILLRWPAEVRNLGVLELNDAVIEPDLAKSEKDMAKRLINDMSGSWNPDEYQDTFQEKIMALVEKKAREGKIEDVEQVGDEDFRKTADVIDLTELLKRSLAGNSGKENKTGKKAAGNVHSIQKAATKTDGKKEGSVNKSKVGVKSQSTSKSKPIAKQPAKSKTETKVRNSGKAAK
jgi:DNA end-binding protein Ku